MNILIIGTTDNVGGASRVSWDIAKEMKRRGHIVHFLVGRKKTSSRIVQQIKTNDTSDFIKKYIKKDIDLYLRQLRDYLLSNDIEYGEGESILNHPWYKEADIVHLHNLHGNFFKLKTIEKISKEKKVIWTLHDMWSFTGHCAHSFGCDRFKKGCGNCPYLKTYFPYFRDNTAKILAKKTKICEKSDLHIVVPSRWLLSKTENSILKNKRTSLIYNGVDTKIFRDKNKINARKKLKLPLNKKIILTVAHGGDKNIYKGGKYLNSLSAELNHDDTLILSIGGSTDTKGLIKSLGYISSQKKLAEYYSAADVFFFPSLAENCPLVVIEAMSCGLPVVAFNVGGIPELVKHRENGYLSKYKDKVDIINGVKYILNLKESAYITMKKQCRYTAKKNFDLRKMADKYEKIFS